MKNQLFATKSLRQLLDEMAGENRLRRVLGPVQLTSLGVGAIIGAGIFVATGTAARNVAGPALMLSYVVAGMTCIFAALCYAEFAAMVPVAGSAYTYAYATLGQLIAWIIGWDLILEYAVGNVAVAISWSNYFQSLLQGFHITWPAWLGVDYRSATQSAALIAHTTATHGDLNALGETTLRAAQAMTNAPRLAGVPIIFNLPAVLIVALITWALVRGIRERSGFNTPIGVLKLAIIAVFVGVRAVFNKPENWHAVPPNG